MANSDLWIILLAGGSGDRFGSLKQFEMIEKKSILERSIQTAQSITSNLVVVLPKNLSEETPEDFKIEDFGLTKNILTTKGGKTRSASVRAGLEKIPAGAGEIILIHDAVRPLADKKLFLEVAQAITDGADAATPTIPLTDTINTTDGEVLDRSKLLSLQTPQAFRVDVIKEIHSLEPEATDDISLCLQNNKKVIYTDGDTHNIKITEPADLKIAELLLKEK